MCIIPWSRWDVSSMPVPTSDETSTLWPSRHVYLCFLAHFCEISLLCLCLFLNAWLLSSICEAVRLRLWIVSESGRVDRIDMYSWSTTLFRLHWIMSPSNLESMSIVPVSQRCYMYRIVVANQRCHKCDLPSSLLCLPNSSTHCCRPSPYSPRPWAQ